VAGQQARNAGVLVGAAAGFYSFYRRIMAASRKHDKR